MKSIHVVVSLPLLAVLLIFQAEIVLSQTLGDEVTPGDRVTPAPILITGPENVEAEAKQVPFIETQGKLYT